jgi:hypothetical protein
LVSAGRWFVLVVVGALILGGCGASASTTSTSQASTATSVPGSSAAGLEAQYVAVVKAIQPEVVQIRTDSGLGAAVTFDAKATSLPTITS